MQAKTIWYLNHYAPSHRAPKKGRPFYLLNAVAKRGYNVAVIGASRHHLLSDDVDQKDRFRFQTVEGLLFGWIRTPAYSGNGVKRIINMLAYSWQLLFLRCSIPISHARPEVIVVSSVHPFHYPVALLLSWCYRVKIVFEVRDIWPLSLHDLLAISKWHPLYLCIGGIERLAYRTANRVISLLENGLVHMAPRGLRADKFCYIPNGIEFVTIADMPVCEHASQLVAIRRSYDFILMYAGAHGVPNALDQLISAAEILQKEGKKIACVLVGEGKEKSRLGQRAKDKRLGNVIFLAPVPAEQVQSLLNYADACFIGWHKKPTYKYGISANKLFEYMKAGKPIIQCIDSSNNPVSLSGCGIEVQPDSPELLAEAIIGLAGSSEQKLVELGRRGYKYVLKKHNYMDLAERFIEACDV